ncbi:MAG: hypothetical protein FDX30_12225 [Chlorobium sp.]|nr:MAG: hypothetical protein FDX30_12225 [Chlorobium sp.]
MAKTKSTNVHATPDKKILSSRQVAILSDYSGVEKKNIKDLTLEEASERLRFKIDPSLLFFREICGKVVKKDTVTGVEYPVPFATVYVEDTDCNLVGYFPKAKPWGWFFPIRCHREVIATTTTDKCGNFCVKIPRFDIDWILRWRRERVCFPVIFKRPSLGDLIDRINPGAVGPWPPIPDPDPGPVDIFSNISLSALEAIGGKAARKAAEKVELLKANRSFGAQNLSSKNILYTRAFETELPPPLPAEFRQALAGQGSVVAAKGASALDGIRSAVAMKLGLDYSAKEIAGFDPKKYIGPFLRCYDILMPEWHIFRDVPDITFRVTQDVNGDGIQENIYSESFFDVRWDADPLPDVTLTASQIARESRACGVPNKDDIPCDKEPAILFAGFMPLYDYSYFDAVSGYALRPNRPVPVDAAQTPFCGYLQLSGCVKIQKAVNYRILQSVDGGTNFSAITGLAWNNYHKTGGSPILISSDTNGWYKVDPLDSASNPVNREDLMFPNLLLDWAPPTLGKTILMLEIGDASKNNIAYSSKVAIQSDNTAPTVTVTRWAWKFAGEDDSKLRNLLGIPCPTISRNKSGVPQDIELVYEVSVSANHFRDAYLVSSGCGGGAFVTTSDPYNNPAHWYDSSTDNVDTLYQRYKLNHTALEGAYSFGCRANSRAINPSGAWGENLVPPDWYKDVVYIYYDQSIGVAVINRD